MDKLTVKGKQSFNSVEITHIEGGFGNGKKCILARDIAEVHGRDLKKINEAMKKLIQRNRIKESVHYIDLLDEDFKVFLKDLHIKLSNNAVNVFLLSERGYASLIKYMDDDLSWEIHDKLIDEYFYLKDEVKEVTKIAESTEETLAKLNEHRFSDKRTIKTFTNADILELPKLLEQFRMYVKKLDSETRLTRYISAIRGVERLVNGISLNSIMLPYVCIANQQKELLLKDKNKLQNKQNGGIKAAQTKKIKKLEEQLPPNDWEYVVLDCHGFSNNYMYRYAEGNTYKTSAYQNWIKYFPYEQVVDADYWEVDWQKPIEVFINYVSKADMDIRNFDKSIIDRLFAVYAIDDNIISSVHSQRVGVCDTYDEGKIAFVIRNV